MSAEPTIFHVDMDAFYASIEQRDDPGIRGKPVLVGGRGARGVVAAASYESRRYGIHSAMPMRQALQRCPDAICVTPRMSRYSEVSRDLFGLFGEFTPVVEGLSLDEAFLDVSQSLRLFAAGPVELGQTVKQRVHEQTGLTASVGIGPNKLVAKIASDLDKPDGLVHVPRSRVGEVFDPLPVGVLPGVGRRTRARLQALGINKLRDLRSAPLSRLETVFGRYAQRMRERAAGADRRQVSIDRADRSISAEQTFDQDIVDRRVLNKKLLALADQTSSRLRKRGLAAGTVSVKIRNAGFETYTRQQQLHPPGNQTDRIYAAAVTLLDRWYEQFPRHRLRLLGVAGTRLVAGDQLGLFDADSGAASDPVDHTVDEIRSRFGRTSLTRARNLPD